MSCEHNTVSRCHQCCSPIIVQVPGLQGTGIVWENCSDEEKKDITDTILTPVIDQAKIVEETSKEVKEWLAKVERLFDDSLTVSGSSCYEEFITVSADISAGTAITIPNSHRYVVGKHQLKISYNGYILSRGQGYNEIGNAEELSNTFSLTFTAKKGNQITIWIEALSKKVVDEAAQQCVDRAKSYADSASVSAAQAKNSYETLVNKQNELVTALINEGNYQVSNVTNTGLAQVKEVTAEGDKQYVRVNTEGSTQVKRITNETNNVLVSNGTGGNEIFWTATSNISAGTKITIPNNAWYIVGRHHFHPSWNGLELYIGQNYNEVGDVDTKSTQFTLTFNVQTGDELDVKIHALGVGNVDEAITTAKSASDAVAELSRKVVYREETV